MASNVSKDVIWEIVNKQSSYTFKQRSGGRVILSRDPLNLTNKHSRKYAGIAADQAIGVQSPPPSKKGQPRGVELWTKKQSKVQHPSKSTNKKTFGGSTSSRKVFKAIASATAKQGYRPDLRREAIARASAIKRSQGKPRMAAEKKPRSKKAKKAAEKAAP